MEVVRVMNEEDRELGLDGERVGIGMWWEWGWDGIGIGLGVWIYLRQHIPPTPQPSPLHPPLRPFHSFPFTLPLDSNSILKPSHPPTLHHPRIPQKSRMRQESCSSHSPDVRRSDEIASASL